MFGGMREVMRRFEPRTANTNCVPLTCQPAKEADELDDLLKRTWKTHRIIHLSGRADQYLFPKPSGEIQEIVETGNTYISQKVVRDDIVAYIERRRKTLAEGPNPMGIGTKDEDGHTDDALE